MSSFREAYGLDVRSLSLVRIVVGLLVLFDLASRSLSLQAHYTSAGVLPLRNFLWQPDLSWRIWSLYYAGDSFLFALIMFGVTAAFALCLVVGFRTRLSTAVVWILLLSLHHRNILVINGGDHYIRMLLFWGFFLPWGARFSVDSVRKEQCSDQSWFSAASFALLIQIALVYTFNAVYKSGQSWDEGIALFQALQLSEINTGLARFLLNFGSLLKLVSATVKPFELLIPVLVLLPFKKSRLLAGVGLLMFHAGILLTLKVDLFSAASMAAALALLPAMVWENKPGTWLQDKLIGFAKVATRRLPDVPCQTKSRPKLRLAQEALVAMAALFMTFYSVADFATDEKWKPYFTWSRTLGLYMKWAMFTPNPPADGWHSVEAWTLSGKQLDLLTERPFSDNKLETLDNTKDTLGRWRMYRASMVVGRFGSNAEAYLYYLVDRWNKHHPKDPIRRAKYFYFREDSVKSYRLPHTTKETHAFYSRD